MKVFFASDNKKGRKKLILSFNPIYKGGVAAERRACLRRPSLPTPCACQPKSFTTHPCGVWSRVPSLEFFRYFKANTPKILADNRFSFGVNYVAHILFEYEIYLYILLSLLIHSKDRSRVWKQNIFVYIEWCLKYYWLLVTCNIYICSKGPKYDKMVLWKAEVYYHEKVGWRPTRISLSYSFFFWWLMPINTYGIASQKRSQQAIL